MGDTPKTIQYTRKIDKQLLQIFGDDRKLKNILKIVTKESEANIVNFAIIKGFGRVVRPRGRKKIRLLRRTLHKNPF